MLLSCQVQGCSGNCLEHTCELEKILLKTQLIRSSSGEKNRQEGDVECRKGEFSAAHQLLKQPGAFPHSACFDPPQYERSVLLEPETGNEFELRTWTRNNITETLNSLNVNTVDDIQQISAALAQCTVRTYHYPQPSALPGAA